MDHRSLRAAVALVAAVTWGLPAIPVAADTTPTTDVIAVSDHTCVVTTGGGAKCWGANMNGQLGQGTTASSGVPVDVAGLENGVSGIAVGGEHSCALTSGGGLKCWGWNATGQLGIGTTTDSNTPVDVVGLASGVSAIAAGGRHTCALMTAGGVSCWGYNGFGQLGDGTTTDSPIPVAVAGLPRSVRAITTGGNFSCALKTDGGVMCWGLNAA